jgi:1-acyl-sn-glycerol-3-phosphate acyltransferase
MVNKILSILLLTFIATTSAILFILALMIWLVTMPFDKKKKILHLYTCAWGAFYVWIVPTWKVFIIDRKNFKNDKAYVVVSNHQSQLDILLAFHLFKHYKWVSKEAIFKVPFIGWNMYLNRYVRLVRGDKESVKDMFRVSEERLQEGSSVYFFPEGTRSHDGKVKDFKPGAFAIAHKMKLPILPIAISGTSEALPKYSMQYTGKYNLYLKVLEEIPYEAFSSLSVEETADMVKKIISDNVEALTKLKE